MDVLFRTIERVAQKNSAKLYLLFVSMLVVVFGIWFFNVGLLPLKSMGDFLLVTVFVLVLSFYRNGWAFLVLVASLVMENVNVAPIGLGLSLRPYQLLAVCVGGALLVRNFKKSRIDLLKFFWVDAAVLLFSLGGFLSALGSAQPGQSFKQAVVSLSFVGLYFLSRIYIQSYQDLKRVVPFFLGGASMSVAYGIWQNVRFLHNAPSWEVMAGRPNATFTEPDWFGMFLVFLISCTYALMHSTENVGTSGQRKAIAMRIAASVLLVSAFVALILSVSRSAWLGALAVTLGYGLLLLFERGVRIGFGQMKRSVQAMVGIGLLGGLALAIAAGLHLTTFQLFNRAQSTASGLQKITIACTAGNDQAVPLRISTIGELGKYGCRHINLEDIEREKGLGNTIMEIYRPDPNVNIRRQIYAQSWEQIRKHPLLGIGWASIGIILGQDERGAGLNASNIFLEIWLGAGLLGVLSFAALLLYIFSMALKAYIESDQKRRSFPLFTLLGLVAVIVPNLFNSGVFLAYAWVFLAASVSLLHERQKA